MRMILSPKQLINKHEYAVWPRAMGETVQTKHGEIVVHDYNVLTYLGHKLWAVTKNREHEDESNR